MDYRETLFGVFVKAVQDPDFALETRLQDFYDLAKYLPYDSTKSNIANVLNIIVNHKAGFEVLTDIRDRSLSIGNPTIFLNFLAICWLRLGSLLFLIQNNFPAIVLIHFFRLKAS